MGQNIYDSSAFYEAYSHYPRAIDGLASASEWPMLQAMLPPDLSAMTVVDLGCGDGWFSRWAERQGAARVRGLDASSKMLSRARSLCAAGPPVRRAVSFRQADMDCPAALARALSLGGGAQYDFAFSGLALHYADDLDAVLRAVYRVLKPDGLFVFSVEHPVFTAPRHPGFANETWPVAEYFSEGERAVTWLGASVRKQHRTLTTYLRALRVSGFMLEGVEEWGATDDESRKHPDWPEGVIPRFLLISARKLAAMPV